MMDIYINCWRLTSTERFVVCIMLDFVVLAWHPQPINSLPLSLSLVIFLSDRYIHPLLKFTNNTVFVICIRFIIVFALYLYWLALFGCADTGQLTVLHFFGSPKFNL